MTKIFKEASDYLGVCSCSDFPRDRKQVTNLKYSKKRQLVEKSDEKFIRNISVIPEKIVSLINDRQLNDIKRFCIVIKLFQYLA